MFDLFKHFKFQITITVNWRQRREMVCFAVNIRGSPDIEMIFVEPGQQAYTTTDWLIREVKGRLGLCCFLRYQLLYKAEHALRADVLLVEEFPRGAILTMEACAIDSYEFVPRNESLEKKVARLEEQMAEQDRMINRLVNELSGLKKWRAEIGGWNIHNFAGDY